MGVGVIHVFVNIILGWMVLIVVAWEREGRGSNGERSEQGDDTELHDETRGLLECNAKEGVCVVQRNKECVMLFSKSYDCEIRQATSEAFAREAFE